MDQGISQRAVSRRRFLGMALLAGVGTSLLAACGSHSKSPNRPLPSAQRAAKAGSWIAASAILVLALRLAR